MSIMIYRYLCMHLLFPITFFTSGVIINIIQCVLHFGLKSFNKRLFRQINYYLSYTYYCQLVFIAQWYSGSDVYVHVNKNDFKKYFGKEHAYIIMNHRYDVDWLMFGVLSEKICCAGNFKAYIKKILQYFPALGWCLYFSENIFVERSFEKDKKIIHKQITEFVNYPDPVSLLICPEGTRYTPKKHEASLEVAREKGLPQYKHHLTPRTKGFLASLPAMRGKMGAIYDTTLSFNPNVECSPKVVNILFGRKIEAHFYIKRIPFEAVPETDKDATIFLHKIFEGKDKLQESFFKTGDYLESGLEKVDTIKIEKSYAVLFNTLFWIFSIMGPLLYCFINVLLVSTLHNLTIIIGVIVGTGLLFNFAVAMTENTKGSNYGIKQTKIG